LRRDAHNFREVVIVQGCPQTLLYDTAFDRAEPQYIHRDLAHDVEIFLRMIFSGSIRIFTERYIQTSVQPILHFPMTADCVRTFFRIQLQ